MNEEKVENASDGSVKTESGNLPVQNVSTPASAPAGETITIKKDALWKYSTFILAAILIVGAFAFFIGDGGSGTGQAVNAPSAPNPSAPSAPVVVADVDVGDAPFKGNENAPVTLIEFTDYQCPFCSRHFTQTYPQIISQYVDTGKVKYVSMDFPLNNIHPEAQKAAEAAHCVRDQQGDDGYFAMHDKIFANQGTMSIDNYKKWAAELKVNQQEFDSCLDSGKNAGIVAAGLQEGQANGIRGTPGFLINGKPLSGAQPFSAFQQAIDAEL
jgi:protein-disulfide isomerase